MIIKTKPEISQNEITDARIFHQRRNLIKAMFALTATNFVGTAKGQTGNVKNKWANLPQGSFSHSELTATPRDLVKNYTNYYEFAFDKESATARAQALKTDPWAVEISGAVEKGGMFYLEDILRQQSLQERVYRFRCVEAWSMVVPWIGFSLADLLKTVKPLSSAKFVKFTSLHQPEIMLNQRSTVVLEWPYVEGLRMDEAMHPLTLLAVGMYGEAMPKQNGAPLRLVVPWKYGFKSIKAIVKIELLSSPPLTTWNQAAPKEYGFYANVNPAVAHPRWSQNSERQLGTDFFTPRRQTELFNGYGEQVAALYRNMDLARFF